MRKQVRYQTFEAGKSERGKRVKTCKKAETSGFSFFSLPHFSPLPVFSFCEKRHTPVADFSHPGGCFEPASTGRRRENRQRGKGAKGPTLIATDRMLPGRNGHEDQG
jgi:hypothetical protein